MDFDFVYLEIGKVMLYQTVYTITKAIQDGNSINSCIKENKGETNA